MISEVRQLLNADRVGIYRFKPESISPLNKVTYQTRLSDSVQDFCDAMGLLFGKIGRDLYKDLSQGKKLNDLKKSYQVKYQINARQFNSIHLILKGKIASRKECHQRQIKELEAVLLICQKYQLKVTIVTGC